jgi:hypothetical protein
VNDLRPPRVRLLSRRVVVGRPTLAIRAQDLGAGVDPYSMLIAFGTTVLGASAYDSSSGVALFTLPRSAPKLHRGRNSAIAVASDFQEAKNTATFGPNVTPNTSYRYMAIHAVRGTTATWLTPRRHGCVHGNQRLLVLAGSARRVRAVRFLDGRRLIRRVRKGTSGLYAATWKVRGVRRGRHMLRAVVEPRSGRRATASRVLRLCR